MAWNQSQTQIGYSAPPTAQDIYSDNKDALYNQFGLNPKGTNEGRPLARRMNQVVGYGLADSIGYGVNTLEPARQNALNYAIGMANPGNVQARTRRNATSMVQQGQALGSQEAKNARARGYSPEYAQAIRALLANRGQRQANQHVGQEDERMMQNQMGLTQMIGQNQVSPLMGQFMDLYNLIQGQPKPEEPSDMENFMGMAGSILPLFL